MKPQEYFQFTPSTAIYPEKLQDEYLSLGIKSEIGELAGRLAKLYRGDKQIVDMLPSISSEIGDIYWFVSQYCHKHDIKFTIHNVFKGDFPPSMELVCRRVDCMLESSMEIDENPKETISDIQRSLSMICFSFDLDIEDVLHNNYTKLTARHNKGTIKGDGEGTRVKDCSNCTGCKSCK